MRKSLCLVLALLLVPGCLKEPEQDDTTKDDDDSGGSVGNSTLPAPLHWEADVVAGVDPFNIAPVGTPAGGAAPCSTDASTCFFHEFSVNATIDLAATLAWQLTGNDFDLYLYEGPREVSRDGLNNLDPLNPNSLVPVTTQVMHANVPPGTYTFWVVAWNAAAESYTLDVTFS